MSCRNADNVLFIVNRNVMILPLVLLLVHKYGAGFCLLLSVNINFVYTIVSPVIFLWNWKHATTQIGKVLAEGHIQGFS